MDAWVILGDFNNVMYADDRIGGLSVSESECAPFRDTIVDLQLQELAYVGWPFTWCYKQEGKLIYTKIGTLQVLIGISVFLAMLWKC